jgi:hypothetical protein
MLRGKIIQVADENCWGWMVLRCDRLGVTEWLRWTDRVVVVVLLVERVGGDRLSETESR